MRVNGVTLFQVVAAVMEPDPSVAADNDPDPAEPIVFGGSSGRCYAQPLFPRWGRIGRIISNVDKYSRILSREVIEEDGRFLEFTKLLAKREDPPYLLYLDKGFFDITLNHICNLKYMAGSVERLAVISFDPEMERDFKKVHPQIPIVTLDFSIVKKSVPKTLENHRYVIYQLVLMLRSHIASVLSSRGISFWSMQQDSIWTENFVSMNVEQHYPDSLLIFDTVGNDQVALLMTRRQSPDSSIMTYLCGAPHYKCAKLPRWVVSSSNFFMGNRNVTPVVIQVDHESKLSKMELFRKENFVFIKDDLTCNASAVIHIKEAVTSALEEVRAEPKEDDEVATFDHILWCLHRWLGLDPYYNKRFLRVHEGIV
ncbi:hypothetical protein ANCCEY_08605 [Ancylostoma ceylanicum]|uniref:Nucleotide-diphospho-sugar transferase domain-containing protein n=1 Tax=Ancylostoma ceylanicum TaxID=53326 RepID=A0A0D6LXH6_9BILA|nr:hypothetical protein ANCCEY_08605 [Ancylostoma ceylanicum]